MPMGHGFFTWVPMCLIATLKHVEEHSEGDVLSSFTNPGKNAVLK